MNAWKAVLRFAVRDARRGRGRSLLVALMVLVPVAAATAGAVLARSSELEPRDVVALRLGDGDVQALVTGEMGAGPAQQDLTGEQTATYSGTPVFSDAEVEQRLRAIVGQRNRLVRQQYAGEQVFQLGDGAFRTDVVELDAGALGAGSTVEVVSGRLPVSDTEVAALVDTAGRAVAVGARLTSFTGRAPGTVYTVVGTYRPADRLGFAGLLARPGAVLAPAGFRPVYGDGSRSWWVVGPDPVSWAQVQQVNAFGGVVLSRAAVAENPRVDERDFSTQIRPEDVVTVTVIVALLVLQITLMVGPAVAVGARRNERLLALLGANGGTPRHLAGAVLAGAAVAGCAGSVVGAGLGVGAAAALLPVLRAQGNLMPRLDVHALDLVGLVLAGTVTAVLAGLLPALRVARIDVVAAITGRRTQTAPRLRVPAAGLVVAAAGAALAWWASGEQSQSMVVLGIGVAEVGLVVATSAVVALFARLAGRAPLSARLALRDAARHRGRTAPALAATIAAVAAATSVVVLGASQLDADRRSWRPQTAVGTGAVALDVTDPRRPVDAAVVEDAVRSVLGPVGTARGYRPQQPADDEGGVDVTVRLSGDCDRGGCNEIGLPVLFLDPSGAGLVAPDGEQARLALEAGKAVVYDARVLRPDGSLAVTVSSYGRDFAERTVTVPAQLADSSQRLDAILLPRSVASSLGVVVVPAAVYARPAAPPSAVEQARLDLALAKVDANLGYFTQGERPMSGTDGIVFVYVGLAVLVALVGTFIAVGLAAADARPDLGTLAAVGADPSVRRRYGAGQAAAVAVPGTLVGGAAGLLAGWILVRLDGGSLRFGLDGMQLVIPPGQVALLLLGVPALAVALGWLTVRSRLEVVRRLGE